MIHPPPNPNDAEARADMREYNALIPKRQRKLYPLDKAVPVIHACHDDGVSIYIDDPASLDSAAQLRDVLAAMQAAQTKGE